MGAALRPRIADEGWAAFGGGWSAKVVADESREEVGGGGVPNPSHLLFVCPESGRK